MNNLSKIAALLLTALCAVPMLTGCSQNPKQQQNIAEEDMPYGSTMREDKTSYAVPVTYDRRFLEEEQVTVVTNFIFAIQSRDGALYQASTFLFYAQYQMSDVYGLGSMDALVDRLHGMIGGNTADDFRFNMLLINDISANTEVGELSVVCEMLSDAYDGEGEFMDTVEHAWDLTVEWDLGFQENTQFAVVNDQHLFLFQTADGWFCLM